MSNYQERDQRKDVKPQEAVDKKPPTAILVEPVEMIGTHKAKFISSDSLQKIVYRLFNAVSPDYEGPRIRVDGGTGEILCDLFFSENPRAAVGPGQFKAITPVLGGNGRSGAASIIRSYNLRNASYNRYELTDEAKEAFAPFIPDNPKYTEKFDRNTHTRKINWKAVVTEDQEQSTFGQQAKVYVRIPVDLNKILATIYGKKSEEGKYVYMVNVNRVLKHYREPSGNLVALSWMFVINQLNETALAEAYREIGGGPVQNTLGIYRG